MKKNNLKKIVIFGVLFLTWAILSLIFIYSKTNITVISKSELANVLVQAKFTELLKGEKITGKVTASEDYLGQISVRFYNYDRINKDEVDFKLFSGSSLIYENVYKTDQFIPNNLFPFGFSTIPDSKGKEYRFEITSIAGKPEDAVTLSQEQPYVATSYQYPKSLLLKNPKLAIEFISKKISHTEYNSSFLFSAVEYTVFISLSLLLFYLVLKGILIINIKKIDLGNLIMIFSLLLLSLSGLLYSLKALHLSESITILSYFLLLIGILFYLIKAKIKN